MNYRSLDTVRDFLQKKKNSATLSAVIAIGWIYSFLQLAALNPGVNLSRFGPGMDILTFLSKEQTNAMSNLISSIPLCGGFGLSWTLENLGGSISMWFSMVLAMMVPTLLIPGFLRSINIIGFITFLFGYVCIWFGFCFFAVAVQWCLQASEVLNNWMVIINPTTSAAVFLLIGSIQLFKPKLVSLPSWPKHLNSTQINSASFSDYFGAGLKRGGDCVYSCSPVMFVMFVFGLMNLVAMAFLTIIMYLMVNAATVFSAKSTGLVLVVFGVLLIGLQPT